MKLTLQQVKDSGLPAVVNLPSCDDRFLALVNSAQQRLVMRPSAWYDLNYRYRVSVTDGILTWPAEIASISAIAVCGVPIPIRDMWFEFLETGYGVRGGCDEDRCSCIPESLDRGVSPLSTPMSADAKIKVYCDLASDVGDYVIVKGYDSDGNWVRTLDGSTWIDGEKIATSLAGTLSTTTFGRNQITAVILTQSDGPRRIYEYNSTTATQSVIAVYQWWETVPSYRRSYVGGICGTENAITINVIAKREFIPVQSANDVLLIGNMPALENMCQAILNERKNDQQAAMIYEARAFRLMDEEAQHYLGPGAKVPIRVEGETWGAGNLYGSSMYGGGWTGGWNW